ncbi:hypothetical protein THFILI_07995 [Thermus filiformis]|uniref:Uncharacterized protein n=1 Tax=Thermus filiformis TaxID=276 RepID=A0A0D6X9H9_THEFI|nr:hypothetical protein THFILI_07995 [Thermus filiformis]
MAKKAATGSRHPSPTSAPSPPWGKRTRVYKAVPTATPRCAPRLKRGKRRRRRKAGSQAPQ